MKVETNFDLQDVLTAKTHVVHLMVGIISITTALVLDEYEAVNT